MISRVIHGQIYVIKNKDDEILYIGSTRRINSSKRFAEHMRLIKQKSINTYHIMNMRMG